jgi:hypothetical protein
MRTASPGPTSAASAVTRARWREGLLLLGFLLVLAAALLTVAIPELAKEPDEGAQSPTGGTVKPAK